MGAKFASDYVNSVSVAPSMGGPALSRTRQTACFWQG